MTFYTQAGNVVVAPIYLWYDYCAIKLKGLEDGVIQSPSAFKGNDFLKRIII